MPLWRNLCRCPQKTRVPGLESRTLSCEPDHSCNGPLDFAITAAPKRLCVMIRLPDHNIPMAYIARLGRARNSYYQKHADLLLSKASFKQLIRKILTDVKKD